MPYYFLVMSCHNEVWLPTNCRESLHQSSNSPACKTPQNNLSLCANLTNNTQYNMSINEILRCWLVDFSSFGQSQVNPCQSIIWTWICSQALA